MFLQETNIYRPDALIKNVVDLYMKSTWIVENTYMIIITAAAAVLRNRILFEAFLIGSFPGSFSIFCILNTVDGT